MYHICYKIQVLTLDQLEIIYTAVLMFKLNSKHLDSSEYVLMPSVSPDVFFVAGVFCAQEGHLNVAAAQCLL